MRGREGWQDTGVRELLRPTAIPCPVGCCSGWRNCCCSARRAGTRSSGDVEVWCRTETWCQSWEWHARSETLFSSCFLNSETCLGIFQQRRRPSLDVACVSIDCWVVDLRQQMITELLQPRRRRRAGEERMELHECCFRILPLCFSAPSFLHLPAVDENRAIYCRLCR